MGTMQWAQIGTQKALSKHQAALCRWCSPGTGCPERLWGLLLGDLPKVPGDGPGQPAMRGPAGAGVRADGLRVPIQPQPLCGSLMLWNMTLDYPFMNPTFYKRQKLILFSWGKPAVGDPHFLEKKLSSSWAFLHKRVHNSDSLGPCAVLGHALILSQVYICCFFCCHSPCVVLQGWWLLCLPLQRDTWLF